MSGCECRTGFFTLRVCEKSVVGRCSTCKRAMCRDHAVPASTTQCLDCLAKEKRERESPVPNRGTSVKGGADEPVFDEDWLQQSREQVRRRLTIGTIGGGAAHHHAGHAFDQRDISAFDHLDVERDDDDRIGSGFGDS